MIFIMLTSLMRVFDAGETVFLDKDAVLFWANDPVTHIYLLLSGTIDLVRYTPNGDKLVLTRAHANQILAEASAYSKQYHCDSVVIDNAVLKQLPVKTFLANLAANAELNTAWATMLARQLQRSRVNSEIRTLKTVAMRLDAWLAENGALPAKGHWQYLAQTLGVSNEALYRELAKRR